MRRLLLTIAFVLAVPLGSRAGTVRLDGPDSWCVVIEGNRIPTIECDTLYRYRTTGPVSHVRWVVTLGGLGNVRCIRWRHYWPAVNGAPEYDIATGQTGDRC